MIEDAKKLGEYIRKLFFIGMDMSDIKLLLLDNGYTEEQIEEAKKNAQEWVRNKSTIGRIYDRNRL